MEAGCCPRVGDMEENQVERNHLQVRFDNTKDVVRVDQSVGGREAEVLEAHEAIGRVYQCGGPPAFSSLCDSSRFQFDPELGHGRGHGI